MNEKQLPRRLAAILAADVAGYSRLVGVDEEGTIARLRALRHELIDPVIAAHRGRVVKRMGDGILIEFASAVDAARCAIDVQCGMTQRNSSLAFDQRIDFRVGIHVGDVVVEPDGDLMGDGVNIAARLETVAESGGICLSNAAYEQVRDKIAAEFLDLGEQNLKNIARPVRAYSVAPSHNAPEQITAPARPVLALPDKPSIAVLPFQNMSADPEQDYFCDGMVEDIITGLSRIRWLFVIARNSSFTYKGRAVDIKQVGRELGVRYVLEGSVRKAGNRVRITGQLIEAETGTHLWAERYERPLDDIFALQDDVTLSVVGALEPSLRAAEIERVRRKRPSSLAAYDLVLLAFPLANAAMPEQAAKSIPLLERALALEPQYALAHGYAALGHQILFMRAGMHDENRHSAIDHAQEAIAHGSDDATALTLAGFIISHVKHDRDAGREAFEAALSLSPSSAMTYSYGCIAMGWAGDAERAIDWAEQSLRLSPVDPHRFAPLGVIALGRFLQERFDDAVIAARKSIQANSGFSMAHMLLAAPLVKLERLNEAREAAARVRALQPGFTITGLCRAFGLPPSVATPLSGALREAGLPE